MIRPDGYQIILVTLLGGAAAFVGAWALTVFMDGKDWRSRLTGLSLCLVSAAICASLWSWGVYGDPTEIWRPSGWRL